MSAKPQIIYEQGKPAFAVIPYEEYLALVRKSLKLARDGDEEYVPFVLSDYINNIVRVARIEAGATQKDLAACLGVTQGYVSKIEGRNFKISDKLMKRVKIALAEFNK